MTCSSSYRPGREIARGGMGAVLDARDQKLGRSVAMKVMLRRNASEEEQQRFLQEARVLGQLAHPNIVPVHDVGTDEQGRLFYTMKLVVGGTLHDVIGKLKAGDKDTLAKYPLNALLTIFQKVCDAVAFAHSRGIIHRDLKPQNIMVGAFGEVLVMDWGLAKILPGSAAAEVAAKTLPLRGQLGQTGPTGTLPLNAPTAEEQATLVSGEDQATVASGTGSASAPKLAFDSQQPEPAAPSGVYATLEGAVMGTPHFMSPEQAEGKIAELDGRSDIFSLGGILYALLTLRPPVEGDSLEEILSKVRSGTIAPPTAFNAPSATTQGTTTATGAVTEPRKIHPLPHCPDGKVPAALSAVTMKALTRDKTRRYQTVAEFTRDIVAYQGGFATSAEDANALTLLRLFIHRHKVLTAAASLIVLLTVGFIFKLVASEAEIRRQAGIATANAKTASENEKRSEANAERATTNEKIANEKAEAARQALAKAALNLAEASMREANGVAMQSALNDVPDDLRDSTWSYLLAQSDSSIARLGAVESIAADPTRPGVFAAADASGKVTIVNVRTDERLLEFRLGFPDASGGTHYRIAFSPDGQHIAAGLADGSGGLVLQRASDGAKVREWASPRSDRLEFGRNDALLRQGRGSLQVWNPTTGRLWWEEKADGNIGVKGCFTPGGNEIVKFTGKDRLQLVKANDGSLVRALGGRNTAYDWFMAVRPDGKAVFTWNETRITECVSLGDGKVLFALPDKKRRHHMGFSRDGAMLLTAVLRDDGIQSIEAWNAKTGEPLRSLLGGQGTITQLGLHPLSGELIVAGASSRVWDTVGPEARWRIGSVPGGNIAFWGPEDWVFGFVSGRAHWGLHRLQPEGLERLWQDDRSGSSLAETSADGSLAVIGRAQGTEIALFRKDGTKVERVNGFSVPLATYRYRPSPKGSRVVLLARVTGLGLRVYDAAGKGSVKLERANVSRITDIRWLSEQQLLGLLTLQAARGDPGSQESIVVWDAGTGKVLQSVTYPSTMDALAIAPDGRRFAEAGADKLVRIRDATTLAMEKQFRAHNAPITVLAWHPTQPIIATGSEDLSIKVWNFETGRLLIEYRDLLNPPDQLIFSPTGRYLAARTNPDLVGRIWSWQGEPQAPPGAASPGTPSQSSGAAGWTDLLASLTPATVRRADTGWRMDGGVLFSSGQARTVLPLPGDFSNASYQVRVRLRRLVPKDFFSLVLPVGSRKVGFVLDGTPDLGFVTGLNQVDGKSRAASPGAVKGLQVRDSEQRELEVTVRLDGAHATITATLDNQPCYSWTGPVASLSQHPDSVPTPPGALAIKAIQPDWVVYEVKVKRLDAK